MQISRASPVTRINYGGRFLIEVETANEKIDCRSVIVTADNRWGTPEEIARLVAFAASGACEHANGAVLVADGAEDKS